jgi:hypothetical protein
MNRLFLMIGVGIAIVALLFLSQGIKKASPTDEDLQKQAQEAAQKNAPPTPPAAPAAKAPLAAGAQPSEEALGNPATAKYHISVGWVYDEANQAHPETLETPLQVVRDSVAKSQGKISAEIVNIDVPTEDRSPAGQKVTGLGVYIDGRTVISDNPSSRPTNTAAITGQLSHLP